MHKIVNTVPADFECCQCGNCCTINGSVAVGDQEIELMAHYLGLSAREFNSSFTELNDSRSGLKLKDRSDGSCIFLEPDRSCRVNPVKPKQCVGFPHAWNYREWTNVCSFNYPSPRSKQGSK